MKASVRVLCCSLLRILLPDPPSLYFWKEISHKLSVYLSHSPEVFQRAFLCPFYTVGLLFAV